MPEQGLSPQQLEEFSDEQLLALVLNAGIVEDKFVELSRTLIHKYQGLKGLANALTEHYAAIRELPALLTIRTLAAMELGNRLNTEAVQENAVILSSSDAATLVADMGNLHQEHVRVILLDIHHRVLGIHTVYIGTLNTSVLRAAEIFREAITQNSAGIILAHNHPSGDPTPSPEDVEMTHQLVAAGSLLDITFVDHLIIGHNNAWRSLKDMGLGFSS